jgi:hypothetical protein
MLNKISDAPSGHIVGDTAIRKFVVGDFVAGFRSESFLEKVISLTSE